MTNWLPELSDNARPRYRAIATAIADAVQTGELAAGDRLPTHRDLAWRLGVTVGTVTRAYREAEQRGYLEGEVGRGTFVRPVASTHPIPRLAEDAGKGRVDLSVNQPPAVPALGSIMSELWGSTNADLLRYQPASGTLHHRRAAAAWLERSGAPSAPDDVVITTGAQHAMLASIAAVTRPGDALLTEKLTYPGIKPLAALLGLRLVGLETDSEGLLIESVEGAIRSGQGRVLYCTPNLHNPTGAVMSPTRRQALADLAQAEDLTIIEDDVYGLLLDGLPQPLAVLAPEHVVFMTGFAKTVAPGIRIGIVRACTEVARRVSDAVRTTTGMAPPLMAELVTRMIHSGQAEEIVQQIREETAARQAMAQARLSGYLQPQAHRTGLSVWLPLPEPWRAQDFVAAAAARGVDVTSPDHFVVGRSPAPHAVRVCLGSPAAREQLDRALGVLAGMLADYPIAPSSIG